MYPGRPCRGGYTQCRPPRPARQRTQCPGRRSHEGPPAMGGPVGPPVLGLTASDIRSKSGLVSDSSNDSSSTRPDSQPGVTPSIGPWAIFKRSGMPDRRLYYMFPISRVRGRKAEDEADPSRGPRPSGRGPRRGTLGPRFGYASPRTSGTSVLASPRSARPGSDRLHLLILN